MKDGWKSRPLGEVATFLNGLWKGEKPPYVTVGVIRNTNFAKDGSIDDSDIAWLEVEAKKFEKRKLQFGDIILEKSGGGPKQPVGRVALFEKEDGAYSFSNFTSAVRVNSAQELDFRFLHKFLFWKYASGVTETMQSHSTGIRNLNADAYKNIEVPLPPFSEQQRIVAVLDKVLAGLATATANAEKNLENARKLFDSHLKLVFARKGRGWTERPLASLCAVFVDSAHRTPKYQPEGIPALRPRDVVNGVLSLTEAARVSEEEYEIQSKRHRPVAGDIVYSRELSFGWAVELPESPRVCLSQGMCLFRTGSDVKTSFLLYVLNGPVGRAQARLAAVGTAHPHINLGDIKGYRIPLPSLDEQREIVKELDVLSNDTQRLTSSYNAKLDLLANLKQSILKKAFSGQLTAPSQAINEAAE